MTKVIGIECGYSSSVVEIPYVETPGVSVVGEEVIFKDAEEKEEYGVIKYVDKDASAKDKILFTSKILRKATPHDIQKVDAHIDLAKSALRKCVDLVSSMGLQMSVFRVGYSFDGNRVHFMFTADDRIDFRDLVKELARILQKQIHLRQIGPRDKAKMIGGYGKCGRPLCCSTWLGKLESIGMEMVRIQGLESKGSSKLSGACGKLLCCLKYEIEAYRELRKKLPNLGSTVRMKGKEVGTVIALDILNQKLKMVSEEGEYGVFEAKDVEKILKDKGGYRGGGRQNEPAEEEASAEAVS